MALVFLVDPINERLHRNVNPHENCKAEDYCDEGDVTADALVDEARRENLPHHEMPAENRARNHRCENFNALQNYQLTSDLDRR